MKDEASSAAPGETPSPALLPAGGRWPGSRTPPEPPLTCRLCGSTRRSRDGQTGEVVCDSCGLVVETHSLVNEPSLRSPEDGPREGRGYGPATSPLLPDKGLYSEIGSPSRDSQGRALSRGSSNRYYHLRKLNHRLRSPRTHQRNLGIALAEVQRLSETLSLSREVRAASVLIYRRALETRATRGKKIVALVAACVYAGCRQCRVPRTLKEVIARSPASRVEVGRAYSALSRELQLKLAPLSPRDYLVRFSQELHLSRPARTRVQQLLERVEGVYPGSGVLPNGILATLIYIACTLEGDLRSQDRVALVAQVTPVTIRNHCKEMLRLLGLPPELRPAPGARLRT